MWIFTHEKTPQNNFSLQNFIVENDNLCILGRLVVMAFNWIVATVCYYGLTLNSVGIGSSVFTSFSLSSAMEIPAYIFAAMVNKKIYIYSL